MRLDQFLVQNGMAPTKSKAQELIAMGSVQFKGKTVTDKALNIKDHEGEQVNIKDNDLFKFVSRAGHKLDSALKELHISVENLRCLDAGASTGGFTDCLLQNGARQVVAFDVGHDQIVEEISQNPKVTSIEGLNVKDIAHEEQIPDTSFDLIVGDLSFISVTKALPHLVSKLAKPGQLLMLVKPQFEVGPKGIGKGGLVRDDFPVQPLLEEIKNFAMSLNLVNAKIITSSLAGRDGNQEYFLYGKII